MYSTTGDSAEAMHPRAYLAVRLEGGPGDQLWIPLQIDPATGVTPDVYHYSFQPVYRRHPPETHVYIRTARTTYTHERMITRRDAA